MCFRCYQNDTAPTANTRSIYTRVDAEQPDDATGAAIVDAVGLASGSLANVAVRDLIRTGKRSGVLVNSDKCTPTDARRVLRACAAGELRAAS